MNLVEAARKMTIGKTAVTRAHLRRLFWHLNSGLALLLFVTGLVEQYRRGFWQMPVLPAVDAPPILVNVLANNRFAVGNDLYPLVLIAAYFQAAVFVTVGLFLFWRKSGDVMGAVTSWLLISIGLGFTPTIVFLPLFSTLWHIPVTLFQAGLFGMALLFLCLFPNGRFSPHWSRFVALIWLGYILLWFAFPQLNPHRAAAIWPPLIFVAIIALGIVFQLWRYRTISEPDEKQQAKWILTGYIISTATLLGIVLIAVLQSPVFLGAAIILLALAPILVPITIGFAIFHYRLWQIDIILNRTLVYGGLTALVTAVNLFMIGGLGLLAAGQQWLLLGVLLATAVTAILLKPAKTTLQTHVNRLIPPPPKAAPTPTEHAPHLAIPRRRGLVAGLLLLALAVQIVLGWLTAVGCHHFSDYDLVALAVSAGSGILFASVGGLILYYRPENRIGWFCLWTGIGLPALAVIELYLHCGLAGQLATPGSAYLAWFAYSFGVVLIILPMFILLPMLYPNGQFLSPRWRNLTIAGLIAITIASLGTGLLPDFGQINAFGASWAIANPFGVAGLPVWWYGSFRAALLLSIIALSVAGITSMIVRLKRSVGGERQQMKWLAYFMATAVVVQLLVFELPGTLLYPELFYTIWYELIILIVFWGYPLIIGIAVFKYRLYAIDLVLNRTLVYGGLTLVVVSIYALTVGVLSLLFHTSGSLVISLIATGIIAAAFQPLRQRLQRGVNRLMFGERDDPAAVLAQLSQRLEAISQPEAVLPAIVETITQALKLPYAAVVLVDETVAAETGNQTNSPLQTFPLVYQSEMVGQLQVAARSPGEVLSGADEQILRQVALQAGTAVHAIRLTHDLQQSRIRLVTTREEERRRLRRDLHDELGPVIASQGLKLAAVRELLVSDPETAVRLLDDVLAKNQNTVAEVRRLVYNLRPPALDELGLVGAIREYVQSSE